MDVEGHFIPATISICWLCKLFILRGSNSGVVVKLYVCKTRSSVVWS